MPGWPATRRSLFLSGREPPSDTPCAVNSGHFGSGLAHARRRPGSNTREIPLDEPEAEPPALCYVDLPVHVVSEDHAINRDRRERIKYVGFTAVVGLLLLLNLFGIFDSIFGIDTAIFLAILAGYKTFYRAISELLERRISADLAIVIAALAAIAIGEYLAAAEAMFIMLLGEGLEAWAAGRTERAIHRFVDQLPHHARILRDGTEVQVHVEDLVPGDVVVVRAGERISADGIVQMGESSVDESPITGESVPRDKTAGEEVFSGTVNGHGLLHIRVTHAGEESTLARLIHLVEEARDHRTAPVVRVADRYARYFLPAILLAAAAVYFLSSDVDTNERVRRGVAVLIVGCPCALILATPAAMVAAIGGLARRGLLARGGQVVQKASEIDTVVFDKTGTLTTGAFEVVEILTAPGHTEHEVLALGATAEASSDHPLAKVIVRTAEERGITAGMAGDAQIVPGRGAQCRHNGHTVRAGNEAFLAENGIEGLQDFLVAADRAGATPVLVASDTQFAGAILLRDTPREGAHQAVQEIEDLGIPNVILLTGDRRKAADAMARVVGITHVEAELLPEQKLDRIKQLQVQGRKVAMIGDGVNDAPALAAADVGVAISGSGADIAAEAADVVDLNPEIDKLPKLFGVSRRAVTTVWQNIILFAGVVNVVAVYIAGKGWMGPALAAGVHQISSIFVMLNSVRLLRVERPVGQLPRWQRLWGLLGIGRLWGSAVHLLSRIDPAAGFAWLVENRRRLVKPAAAAYLAGWVLTAVYTIRTDELGVIERFGRKVLPYRDPGVHLKLPWPVDRLTRIRAREIRAVEIGFRTSEGASFMEPPAYEWNLQHRDGRIQRNEEEVLMLTGDQNMIEMTAVVHYDIERPDDYLFQQLDAQEVIRASSEAALCSVVNTVPLDALLTTGRREAEKLVADALNARLHAYRSGVRVLHVRFQDLHPSVEVVDAFREVAGALEEKSRMINEAEGYANEQVALARGQGAALVQRAKGYRASRSDRAEGDAIRFRQLEAAYRLAPSSTSTRLYLETMEEILPGRRKLILDSQGGRRTLWTLDDGVLLAPRGAAMQQPPPPFEMPEIGE